MNILLVIFNANPSNGGAERYTADLAAGLLSRGHQVSLAAAIPNPNPPKNLNAIRLPAQGLTRTAQYRNFLNSLDQLLTSQKFDKVHAMLPVRQCDLYHPHAGVEWDWLATGQRLLKRLSNPRRFVTATVESNLLKNTPSKIICLSNYIKQSIQTHYQLPPDRLKLVYNGIDLARFTPGDPNPEIRRKYNIPHDAPLALMIANDFHRKGLMETLLALKIRQEIATEKKHPFQPIHLLVAGKEDPQKYQSHARVFEIADQVHFIGKTSNAQDLYRSADFFVLPTKHDPCSLVVLEALATGLPILTTQQNGAGELAGKAGLIIDSPKELFQLKNALDHLANPQSRAQMKQAALHLRPSLSQESHLDQIINLYTQP